MFSFKTIFLRIEYGEKEVEDLKLLTSIFNIIFFKNNIARYNCSVSGRDKCAFYPHYATLLYAEINKWKCNFRLVEKI